ncbi:MAG: hypothetical protein IPM29_19505 [Planctomycetes bacterium]|nr:hypothetical protein [Planctomycetota bacterium]
MNRPLLALLALLAFASAHTTAQSRYGSGTAGTAGIVPAIWFGGVAYPGNPAFAIELAGARGGAPALLAFGVTQTRLPVLGIDVLVVPIVAAQLGPTSGSPGAAGAGELTATFALPAVPSLIGSRFDFQWIVLDAGAPQGLAATTGLEVRVGETPLVVACGSQGSLDPIVALDLTTGTLTSWQPGVGANNPTDVVFTPDGRIAIVSASLSREFVIVDATRNGARLGALRVPGLPNSAIVTPDGRRAYGITGGTQGSGDGRIHEFDIDPTSPTFGQELAVVAGVPGGADQLEGLGMSRDGRVLTVANLGLGQTPLLLFVDTDPHSPTYDTVLRSLTASNLVTDVEPSHDGQLAFAAIAPLGGAGSVQVVHVPTGTTLAILPGVGVFPTDLDIDPLGRYAYLACGVSGEVVRVNVDPSDPAFGSVLATTTPLQQPFSVAVSADGRVVWSTQQNGQDIVAIDTATMTIAGTFPVGPAAYAGIAVR